MNPDLEELLEALMYGTCDGFRPGRTNMDDFTAWGDVEADAYIKGFVSLIYGDINLKAIEN